MKALGSIVVDFIVKPHADWAGNLRQWPRNKQNMAQAQKGTILNADTMLNDFVRDC